MKTYTAERRSESLVDSVEVYVFNIKEKYKLYLGFYGNTFCKVNLINAIV